MTAAIDQPDTYTRLANEVAGLVGQSRQDLRELSNLHPDFIEVCFAALDAKKKPLPAAVVGWEIFPHLVARSLDLDDQKRRTLAAACVALSGYSHILDDELDQKGYLDGRVSIAASALLGWAIATLGRYTAGTPFADVFVDSVNRAFAGQYDDMRIRSATQSDRTRSDIEKNRGLVATMAGFCGAGGESNDRLVRMIETLIGPMQMWDDFQDIEEDYREGNLTGFVRILSDCATAVQPLIDSDAMYGALIHDPRTTALMKRIQVGLADALLLLDANRDQSLIAYLGELRDRIADLTSALDDFQRDPPLVAEGFVVRRVRRILDISSGMT
jgi:hypothetical protein